MRSAVWWAISAFSFVVAVACFVAALWVKDLMDSADAKRRYGSGAAQRLADRGHVMLVLDGLDEMPESARRRPSLLHSRRSSVANVRSC